MKHLALKIPGYETIEPVRGMPSVGSNLLTYTLPHLITLLFVGGTVLALFFLIFGGIKWITSGGEKEGLEKARKTIIYAVLGLIVIFASYFIVNVIGSLFGIKVFSAGCSYITQGIVYCP